MSELADDTKLGIDAADQKSARALQSDIAVIGEWFTVWQKPFNLDKGHALHVDNATEGENYSLIGSEISSVTQERDFGVVTTVDLKSFMQCTTTEQKVQEIVWYIKRLFRHQIKYAVLTLHRALLKPLLEYCGQFWSPI